MSPRYARWIRFELRKPRHPLLRVACAVIGLCLLAGLVLIGLVIGSLMLAFTLLRRLLYPVRAAASDPVQPVVIEGEYAVVRERSRALRH